jgi:hypothetical protein
MILATITRDRTEALLFSEKRAERRSDRGT